MNKKVYIIYKRENNRTGWHLYDHSFNESEAKTICRIACQGLNGSAQVGYIIDDYTGYIPQMPLNSGHRMKQKWTTQS